MCITKYLWELSRFLFIDSISLYFDIFVHVSVLALKINEVVHIWMVKTDGKSLHVPDLV